MADWEKVKKGLENCLKGFDCPPECPYLHDCNDLMKPMFVELAKDAYDMLKEQEAKLVLDIADSEGGLVVGKCPRCDRTILSRESKQTNFCRYCGQAVKWNASS